MPRMVDLNVTTYWWIPATTGTLADVTLTALTPAANISSNVVSTTTVGPAASDTISERSITDTANVVVPTIGNYEGSLVLFRDYTTTGEPGTSDPLTVIAGASGELGWLVRRVGKPASEAAAAGDVVEAYLFLTDNPQIGGGSGDGYLKATIPLLQQGVFKTDLTLAA